MFSGVEETSIELGAALPPPAADALARGMPEPLTLERDAEGRGVASLLALEMRGLGLRGVPGGLAYREVLHRVGVSLEGAPAWLAQRCDLDRVLVRAMAARVIRYPVASARITIAWRGDELHVDAAAREESLSLRLRVLDEEPPATPPRRTFVVHEQRLLEIPWAERPAPWRRLARVLDARAPFMLDEVATIHRGRRHFCGPARLVR